MVTLQRVRYDTQRAGLRLGVLRGVFLDADGEEVGSEWDYVEFRPDGRVEVAIGAVEGEFTETFVPETEPGA